MAKSGRFIKVTGPHIRDGKAYGDVKLSPWFIRLVKVISFLAVATVRLRLAKPQAAYDWAVGRAKWLLGIGEDKRLTNRT